MGKPAEVAVFSPGLEAQGHGERGLGRDAQEFREGRAVKRRGRKGVAQVGDLMLIPPFCSVPILLFVLALGSPVGEAALPLPLWGGVILAYGFCSTLYVLLTLRGVRRGRGALQLMAQGILLPPSALAAGAPGVVAWAGVALLLAGLALGGLEVVSSRCAEGSASGEESPPCLDTIAKVVGQLPLPVILSDTRGVVRGVSPAMVPLLAEVPPPLEGKFVDSFMDIGAQEVLFQGKPWLQEQVPLMEEGAVLFLLSPGRSEEPTEDRSSGRPSEGVPLIDPRTGLFNEAFVKPRCEEEIARDYRYRRWMTGVWLRLDLRGVVSPTEERLVREDFAKLVRGMIRTCDLGFALRNGDVFLILPETPLGGAQTLVRRVYDQAMALMVGFAKTGMKFQHEFKAGFYFYKGTEALHVHTLLESLQSSLKTFSPKEEME